MVLSGQNQVPSPVKLGVRRREVEVGGQGRQDWQQQLQPNLTTPKELIPCAKELSCYQREVAPGTDMQSRVIDAHLKLPGKWAGLTGAYLAHFLRQRSIINT